MSSLLRLARAPILLRETPGASTSAEAFRRSFSATTPSKAGAGKGGKQTKGVQKRAQKIGGSRSKKPPSIAGRQKVENYSVIKLDHELWVNEHQQPPAFEPTELTRHIIGKPRAFPSSKTSILSTFGVPKLLSEEFRHASKPFAIIRDSTLKLLDAVDASAKPPLAAPASELNSNRLVITGPAGSGKSVLLLQAANYCALSDWIVFYVPRSVDWVNSTSPYAFDYRSQLFHQPELATEALTKLLSSNGSKLSKIPIGEAIPQPGGRPGAMLKAETTLEELVQLGIKDAALAPQTLVLLFEALGKQTQYPFLLAIDDFQALYNTSAYRDPQFKPVPSYHLSMPRLILEYASGKRQIARGALLGALTLTQHDYPVIPPLRQTLNLPFPGDTEPSAFSSPRKAYADFAQGLRPFVIPDRFSTQEAASLMDAWSSNRVFHTALNDSFFMAKYTETGGNPRELLRRGIMGTLES